MKQESRRNFNNYKQAKLVEILTEACAKPEVFLNFAFLESGITKENQIKIGVRFESVSNSLQTNLKNIAQILNNSTEISMNIEAISENIGELNSAFIFKPLQWIEVNGREVFEEDWLAAKQTEFGYLLPNELLISKADYEKYLEIIVIRQRVLARFNNVSLGKLWQSYTETIRASQKKLIDTEEYLEQLTLNISANFDVINADIPKMLAGKFEQEGICAIKAQLRPYQFYGVAWLFSRVALGLGCCLADEMGLGKTLQVISLLALREKKLDLRLKHLIVVPKSLIVNWEREFKRFAPTLAVGVFEHGIMPKNTRIVIISYAKLRINIEILKAQLWDCLILDEATKIKNADTLISQKVKEIVANAKIALTGTPIENQVREIWNLVDWLNSGFLGGLANFEHYIRQARNSTEKMKMLKPIHAALAPIMLRRLKNDPKISLDLPEKVYENSFCSLSEEQQILYRSVIELALNETADLTSSLALSSKFLKAIMHLKQICNHPECFYSSADEEESVRPVESKNLTDLLERSGKLALFFEIMEELKEAPDGVVVFTQFRSTAAVLQKMFTWSLYPGWEKIDFLHGGLSESERMDMVDSFQARCKLHKQNSLPSCPVLILSLHAGGIGLNLMEANRVIHYDRWWNPAIEDQASDRVHRIGQDKNVFIHTMTTENTLEESLGDIIEGKRELAQDLLGLEMGSLVSNLVKNVSGFRAMVDPKNVFVRDVYE